VWSLESGNSGDAKPYVNQVAFYIVTMHPIPTLTGPASPPSPVDDAPLVHVRQGGEVRVHHLLDDGPLGQTSTGALDCVEKVPLHVQFG